jgi:hypothetical protein
MLCVLSIVLVALPACDGGGGSGGGGEVWSDEALKDLARLSGKALRAAGKTAESAMKEIEKQAKHYGPRAAFYIKWVIYFIEHPED